jgi:hypothetical protein
MFGIIENLHQVLLGHITTLTSLQDFLEALIPYGLSGFQIILWAVINCDMAL